MCIFNSESGRVIDLRGTFFQTFISVATQNLHLQSVSWSLAEFRHNKIVQSPHENYFNVCRQHKEKFDLVKMTIIQTG